MGESSEFQTILKKGPAARRDALANGSLFSYEGKKLGGILDLNEGEIKRVHRVVTKNEQEASLARWPSYCPETAVAHDTCTDKSSD